MSNKYWVIIPAAGIGSRMGGNCPKQYLPIQGKTILQHTLERFNLPIIAGIVVCIADYDSYWDKLTLPMPIIRAAGGKERCHSVLNGLQVLQQYAQPNDWVLVHDAARPCVKKIDIEKLINQLANHPVGGLLALPVRDTMKRSNADVEIVKTVEREGLWHALTPQMFRLELLFNALRTVLDNNELVTDEAQAVEKQGLKPLLVTGHANNIKITHPQDLSLAELYLRESI
ncbi:2-C-methyl-D-erythritol 4-phosphate cytidylyltransferase [Candidatus Halobeggiatoa sp. HSG11]|nr:2-C-methyl-D-erythritol 4-phosphate cytidylyltransferase [Candidatus Halobeggiatoa sp. HSG11]